MIGKRNNTLGMESRRKTKQPRAKPSPDQIEIHQCMVSYNIFHRPIHITHKRQPYTHTLSRDHEPKKTRRGPEVQS